MGELGWGCPEANLEVIGEVIPGTPQRGVGKGDGKLKGALEGRSLLWAAGLHPVRASGRWCILPESPQRWNSDPLNSVRSWLGLCQGWSLPSTPDPFPSPAERACGQQELLDGAAVLASRSPWHRLAWCEWEEMAGLGRQVWETLGEAPDTLCEKRPGDRREPANKPLISLWVILILEWRLCSKISFWKEPKSGYT